jgi:dihydrofolate reductase
MSDMRKVILAAGISLDGYIARPDGSVDFLNSPDDFSMAALFSSVDTAVMGRKTYEVALKLGDTFSDPGMTNYVLSRSLPAGRRGGVEVVRESPGQLIGRLRAEPGKHIWLIGGGEVVRQCLEEDLIDEFQLGVIPVLIGAGLPLFPAGFAQRDLSLIENKTHSGGMIELKYERARSGG